MLPTEPFRASSALDDWPDSPLDCISPAQGDVEVAHGGDEHGEDREAIHAGANQEGGHEVAVDQADDAVERPERRQQ